jgi:cytosine deaminase
MGLGEQYGLAVGRPASFVVLPASSRVDAVRRQTPPRWVVARGRVVAERDLSPVRLDWGGQRHDVDFVRAGDGAPWREARVVGSRGMAEPDVGTDAPCPAEPLT